MVERKLFGTDGVRGVVGEDLTPELVERLGKAAALWSDGGRVFVGRDTRGSGPEARVSRPTKTRPRPDHSVAARPRRSTRSAVRTSPTIPRTPSVPK